MVPLSQCPRMEIRTPASCPGALLDQGWPWGTVWNVEEHLSPMKQPVLGAVECQPLPAETGTEGRV